jgi:starch-binding outer membrane protein, SusD/RagB family
MKNNRLINILRRRLALALTIILIISSSCKESVLDETPIDFLSPGNAYSTPAGVELGIVYLHTYVRSSLYYDIKMPYFATGTDEAYHGEAVGSAIYMNDYSTECVPSGSYPASFWSIGYKLVQLSNLIIDAINNNVDESLWTDDSEKNALLGEALFFRAYAYRMLVYLFGDIPLQTEPVSSAKTDFVRTAKSEVYAQIESDLSFAAANLPTRGNEDASGRITQGAAWHLLSEIYLAESKYQLAVDAASHVIDDYGYALMTKRFGSQPNVFGTENVYFDLFTKDNQNLSENTETIWAIQFEPNVTGGLYYQGPRGFGPAYFRMGNTPDGYKAFRGELYNGSYTGYSDTLSRPVAWARPTSYVCYKIWQNDWDNDYRNTEACIKRHFYFDNPASAYDGMEIKWSLYNGTRTSPLKDTTQYIYPYFMKVNTPLDYYTDLARSGGGYIYKDIYAMRLAETYLLRAEGYLGLGETDLAAADINVVRNRSNAKSVSASDVTIDYILDERARELYSEETRLLTLMRLGKLVERVKKYNDNPVIPSLNIQSYNDLYPIPQTVIDLNTGATLEQNSGY